MTTEHETDIATLEQEESKIALAALSLDGEVTTLNAEVRRLSGLLHEANAKALVAQLQVDTATGALQQLARLGNGDMPGNSEGNTIAITALTKMMRTHSTDDVLVCSICGEPQVVSPSGRVCKNGHGGAEGIT